MSGAGLRPRAEALTDTPVARLLAVGLVLGTAIAAVLVAVLVHRPTATAHVLRRPGHGEAVALDVRCAVR